MGSVRARVRYVFRERRSLGIEPREGEGMMDGHAGDMYNSLGIEPGSVRILARRLGSLDQ